MFNWYDDADVQIIGYDFKNMNLKDQLEVGERIQKFNESMRYKNYIKTQEKEIKRLKLALLEEQVKNAKNDLRMLGEIDVED